MVRLRAAGAYRHTEILLHSCFDGFIADSLNKRDRKFWYHRNAPKIITDSYYTLASIMRGELSRDVSIPPGDDRKRIDRHKIASGLLCAICGSQPIRLQDDLRKSIQDFNALFAFYVVGAFFEKWYEDRGLSFQITESGHRFLSEHLKWLALHPSEVQHQCMAQMMYLFEMTCMHEKRLIEEGCANSNCLNRENIVG